MKILFITCGSPWPTTIGVNQRTFWLHKSLSEIGKVDLIINSQFVNFTDIEKEIMCEKYGLLYTVSPLSHASIHQASRKNFQGCINYLFKKREDWFGNYITNKVNEKIVDNSILHSNYNVIVTRYLRSATNTGAIKFSPCLLDVDDLNMEMVKLEYEKKKFSKFKKTFSPLYCELIKIIECFYLKKFDFLWFSKESDRLIFKNHRSCVLPNLFLPKSDLAPTKNRFVEGNNVILFVGSMKHSINVDAVDRFVKTIWPKILSLNPDAVLRIVGTGTTEMLKERWNRSKGVQAVGFVQDISCEYERCAFSIIPIQEGGGTKIKLIESLSYGKTCVVTPHSMRGYENLLKDGEDILIAETDDAIVQKCLELLDNPQKRIRMGKKGQTKVTAHFTYTAFKNIVENTISQVACEGKRVRLRH